MKTTPRPIPKSSSRIVPANGNSSLSEETKKEVLGAWSFPNRINEQAELNLAAQTPDEFGRVLCWRRRKRCNNRQCVDPETGRSYKFKRTERELWNCPLCGKDRHCREKVNLPNCGCRNHGGASPSGWDSPHTKTGEHSKYIKVNDLRARFEEFLNSPQLLDTIELIAFKRARMAEIMEEYDGSLNRTLLQQMAENRKARQAELAKPLRKDKDSNQVGGPDGLLLRRLDADLDDLIANANYQFQLDEEWSRAARQLTRLIAARDKHIISDGLAITPEQAEMMLVHVEETFAVGLNMLLSFSDSDLNRLLEKLDIQFEQDLTRAEKIKMKEGFRDFQMSKQKEIQACATQRIKELAHSGLV